jgi:transcriptional regulator with XRE-family HTH domain
VKRLSGPRTLRNLGRRIGELRVRLGMTQEALAERMRVAPRWLQSVEAGRENATVETLVRFANALRVPVGDLFEPPTTPRPRPGRPRSR